MERTLDIIEEWERETGGSVLKGLFIALWEDQEYLLSHPRLDVAIYHERHMIGKEDRDIVQDRQHYGKPAISVHNGPFRRNEVDQRHFRTKLYLDVPETVYRTHYHWTGMMEKVQGLGEYFEDYADINLSSAEVVAYGQRTRFVVGFFRSLLDYAALRPSPALIVSAPGHYRHVLASSTEMIVYLHTQDWDDSVPAGERLALKNVPLDDGPVNVLLLDAVQCTRTLAEGTIHNRCFEMILPGFHEGIALYVTPRSA